MYSFFWANDFLHRQLEAGEVKVPSSSQTNTALEVNIESTPDQAQGSLGDASFSADITKTSTSSPPPLTSLVQLKQQHQYLQLHTHRCQQMS
jgi:hypothetical protein